MTERKQIDWTKPLRTIGDKREVIIHSTNWPGPYPIIGHFKDDSSPIRWTQDGLYCSGNTTTHDLENAPPKSVTMWVNLYRSGGGVISINYHPYPSEEFARIRGEATNCFATVPIQIPGE